MALNITDDREKKVSEIKNLLSSATYYQYRTASNLYSMTDEQLEGLVTLLKMATQSK